MLTLILLRCELIYILCICTLCTAGNVYKKIHGYQSIVKILRNVSDNTIHFKFTRPCLSQFREFL